MIMRTLLYLALLCFLGSCKSDAELSMERGIHYYDWQMFDEAILEFNKDEVFDKRKPVSSWEKK